MAEIQIETDEDGFWLVVEHDSDTITAKTHEVFAVSRTRITDPEAFYDHVKASIGPWLYEAELAQRTLPTALHCDPEESGGYDVSDPKHPDWHSVHADLYDSREGK